MASKRKRSLSASERRRRRLDPDDDPPAPVPELPDNRVYNSFFNRKSKIATLLTPNYRAYKDLFRNVAEEFTIARRDALNFVLFMIIQWFNTQRVELYAYQVEQAPQVQAYMRTILHETRLMNQLRDLLQRTTQLLPQQRNIPNQYENLLEMLAQIQNYFTEMLPTSQRLDDLLADLNNNINSRAGQLDYERKRIAQDVLSLNIHLVLLDLHPEITQLRDLTARAAEAAKNTLNPVEEQLTALYDTATEDQKVILQNSRDLRDLERKIRILREKYTAILRERPLDQSDNARLQTIRQIQVTILTSDAAIQRMREKEEQDRVFLNQNEIARDYILNTQLLFQLTDISEIFTKIFQIVDSTMQQIVLGLRDPEYNFVFPSVTNDTFWSHVYRKVLADPENENRRIIFNRSITAYFDDFDISRKVPGTNNYLYNLPVVDHIHKGISRGFTGTIIQNVTMHLLSINIWIIRLFKGFLLFHQAQNNVQLPIMAIAKKAANKIIRHLQYEDLPNEEEIPGLKDLYDRIKLIYDADFLTTEPDDIFDYESAKARPLKYLRVSYRLLQEASSHGDWPVKLWSLLPSPSTHRIVHFPLNSHITMYGLFQRANIQNIRVPDFLLGFDGNLIGITAFSDMYTGRQKQEIWETIFSINKLEKRFLTFLPEGNDTLDINDPNRRVKLGFGLTTDGHMILILFERVSREFVAFTTKEVKLQKRNLNLINKTRGVYPLYKNPTGITPLDRIIGIDPGVRDIVCAVDCTPQELTNKYTTKEHSLSISNASYKLRSGMQWINQRELQSREKSGIQLSYDRLKSSKVCTNDGIKQFLNSLYQEHQNIFNFMRSYNHRENLGYAFSNRQRTQDFVARVIIGTTNKEEPYKLSNASSSKYQRNIRKKYRRKVLNLYSQRPYPSYPPSIRNLGNQRTVVAYGDASIRGTYKGNTPVPVKAIQRAIATKAVVIPVDEFRTSITCSHCFERLENTPDERHFCTHKKKLHRSNGKDTNPQEKKAVMKCFNEEGHVLYKTSECPERVRPRQPRNIYPLKLCRQCQAGNNADPLYWNRDVNAASNIRHILWRYITEGFDLNSRPPALSRIREINDEDEENEL